MKRILTFLGLALWSSLSLAANQAVLAWGAVTKDVEGNSITGVTYTVYQGVQGQPKAKTGSPVSATTVTITSGLSSGRTYCWQVSASANGVEGALSNEACKSFPPAAPEAPASLTAQ